MNIVEEFTPQAIAAHWEQVASNMIDLLGVGGLFTRRKKAGLDLSWFKGSRGIAVSLAPSAFDAKAGFRDRPGFEKLETEMPFFREGFKIKERDRQELLRVLDSGDPYAQEIINRVYDDSDDLIAGADTVPERMIFQLLFNKEGKPGIDFSSNGVSYKYDYDPKHTWNTNNYKAVATAWSEAKTADPFKDLKAAKDAVRSKTGTELTRAIMNTTTFNLMAATDAVKNRYLSSNGLSLGYLTDDEVKAVVSGTSRLTIAIYDKQYKDEKGEVHSYVPDGYVALIPDGTLGSVWYGTTPEEADLMGSGQAEVSIVNTGVAITREITVNPVNVNTFASEIVLPSWERMDECYLLKVVGE